MPISYTLISSMSFIQGVLLGLLVFLVFTYTQEGTPPPQQAARFSEPPPESTKH